MKTRHFIFLLFVAISNLVYSQNPEQEVTMSLLANDNIAEVNLDQDAFIKSIGTLIEYCKSPINIPQKQKVGILLIVHKSGKPTCKIYTNPSDKNLEDKITTDINKLTIENTKLLDFPIFIAINSKNDEFASDFPDYRNPVLQRKTEFENADLNRKLRLIKEYAINEVIPVLSAYEVIVDEKFAGVKGFGKSIEKLNFKEQQNIESLTGKQQNYWRAIMEMNIGNQLIPITNISMLVAQGELDYAKKYIEIFRMYSDPKTIPDSYLEELNYKLNLFNNELNKEIQKGIAEHDKGNYQKAITIYDSILAIYPNSSSAIYEKYYSENTMNLAENKITADYREDWDKAKTLIYKHNPLYEMDVRASNGKEAYLIFRRQEIGSLFKKKEDRSKDIFKYAEIATDLGAYEFAAHLFWITATFDSKNSQTSINNYLYCLERLEVKGLKQNFKGNFDKIFKEIEENKNKAMQSSSIYKSMKN